VLNILRQIDRERIAGAIIFISIFVVLLSMVGIRFLDVKVSNIEFVDRGLYTIITDHGSVNIDKDNILRIERTYAKAAMTGTSVELDRIYTTKGFIYFSSLDPFYNIGHQLINSVDFQGKPIWIRTNNNGTESDASSNQQLNANLRLVQPFNYAIGTPLKLSSIVFFVLSLQYLALAVGGMALMILIFPLRLGTPTIAQTPFAQQESEYRSAEEQLGAVAK